MPNGQLEGKQSGSRC